MAPLHSFAFLLFVLALCLTNGCVRDGNSEPRDAGAPARMDAESTLGLPFQGPLELDDARVSALVDPTLLELASGPCRAPALVRVREAIDGDTLFVVGVSETLRERVRLIGVDTPEIAHDDQPVQCFGPEAKAFTEALEGRLAWLTFGPECRDRFDRLLAYVHLGPGPQDVWERQLIRRGLAKVLIVAPNRSLERTLRSDEDTARSARVGLWSACN